MKKMIQKIKLSFGNFTVLFAFGVSVLSLGAMSITAQSASAETLYGRAMPGSILFCELFNPTEYDQMIDTVQYDYACNNGPNDPFHYYFEARGCTGFCLVKSHESYLVTNGPFTGGCWVIQANCIGFSHKAFD